MEKEKEIENAEELTAELEQTEDLQLSNSEESVEVLDEVKASADDSIVEAFEEDEFLADGTELDVFESAEIEEREFLETKQIQSIIESVLFATEKPQSLSVIKQAFKGTQVKIKDIRKAIKDLSIEYAGGARGVSLEEINGGYQLRTKVDNMDYLKRMIKARPFKLSGPALEVISIVAYKQPIIKAQIDEIRGVESGHLLRALMEKQLVAFAGKSEFPGKPMLYQSTRRFLEIFGLRNLKELPSLSEIDELIPEGIGDVEEKETLSDVTDSMAEETAADTYSEGEDELMKISEQLSDINTSSEFFEIEKQRQKDKKEAERAQDIREALAVDEDVSTRDKNWLLRYEEKLEEKTAKELNEEPVASSPVEELSVDKEASGDVDEKSSHEELSDVAGEVESDLDQALERFDTESGASEIESEETSSKIGDVDVSKLNEDLKIFDEETE